MSQVIELPFRQDVTRTFDEHIRAELVKLCAMELIQAGQSKILEVAIECFDGKKHVFNVSGFQLSNDGLCQAAREAATASSEYAEERKQRAAS